MTFGTPIMLASAVWLLSCGASVVALYWNVAGRARRGRAALVSSCVALLIAYGGLSRIRLSASKTVDGHIEWSVDSRWFFAGALILGAATLALTLWNWRRAAGRLAAGSPDGEVSGAVGPAAGLPPPPPPHNPPCSGPPRHERAL
jgi:hypothetical protein